MKIKFPASRIRSVIGSRTFFRGIVALLILEAGWIALTGRYPMAFDEDFHLGIIRLYAHHISPFWSGQPSGADAFGAVTRDPSYLYQYLMSFPYRLISLFTQDQNIQVIILRFINIGLFTGGLVAMRKLLLKTGAGRTLINLCLLAFILIPVASQLAAQINYDNMFLPLTTWSLIWTLDLGRQISSRKLSIRLLFGLAILCLLNSLVKYAYLPIFAAILIYLGFLIAKTYRPIGASKLGADLRTGWRSLSKRSAWLLIAGLIIAGGLFAERYVVNLVRYQTPIPDCGKVLSVNQCSAYGPWIRDYNFAINKVDEERNPLVYTADWFYGMWLRLFFAVDGPATQFQTRGPLLVPAIGSIVAASLGLVLFIAFAKRIYRRYNQPALWLLSLTTVLYTAALWLDDYRSYLRTGQPVAINGRYLFPVLLPIILFMGLAYIEWLRTRLNYQLLIATLSIVTLAWGGGGLTYILRSNDYWYWNSRLTRDANHAVQSIAGPITPGFYSQTQFLR